MAAGDSPFAWKVGSHWNYKADAGDAWMNYTVEALEDHRGQPTYRVRVNATPNASELHGTARQWVSRHDLGMVAQSDGSFSHESSCSMGHIFPMVRHNYTCDVDIAGHHFAYFVESQPNGTEAVTTQVGVFQAHVLEWTTQQTAGILYDSDGGYAGRGSGPKQPPTKTYYSEEVQNRVQFQDTYWTMDASGMRRGSTTWYRLGSWGI